MDQENALGKSVSVNQVQGADTAEEIRGEGQDTPGAVNNADSNHIALTGGSFIKPNKGKQQTRAKKLTFEHQTRLSIEKQNVFNVIEQEQNKLNDIGHYVWRFGETGGSEVQSSKKIVDYLENKGFRIFESNVRENQFGTAFRLDFKKTQDAATKLHPNIAFLCEYNAEPKMGHCYGHNLATAVCIGAAIGLQRVIGFSKSPMGRVTVIGCPSNATKTSKKEMVDAGLFRNIDFVIAAYPANFTCLQPKFLNSKKLKVTFKGRSLNDGVETWETANPLNGAMLTMQNLAAHKQNFLPGWTINSAIPNAGEDPCTQPEKATCLFEIRSPTRLGINVLNEKMRQCLDGAATASGCSFDETVMGVPMIDNIQCPKFVDIYRKNAKLNGFTFHDEEENKIMEPDDISFVSQQIPTFKIFYYAGTAAKRGTDEFNRFCGSAEAEYMNIVQGKSLAMMAVDLMKEEELMNQIVDEHRMSVTMCKRQSQSSTLSSDNNAHSISVSIGGL